MVMLMSENAEQRHEHHGRSSKDFLDSEKILEYIDIKRAIDFWIWDRVRDISLSLPRRLSGSNLC
jgi:hypothetical protein